MFCNCGAAMISDGVEWRCGLRGSTAVATSILIHSGDVRPDKRLGLARGPLQRPPRTEGPPGPAGSHSRVRLNCRLIRKRKRDALERAAVSANRTRLVWRLFDEATRQREEKRR